MRIAFLVPDPDYPEPWRWAFDVEAQALIAAGAEVEPVSWTWAGDLAAFDLVLPLVAWGYHLRYGDWPAFLDRIERAGVTMLNSPALLRWNGDKAYLAELADAGVPQGSNACGGICCDADLEEARRHFDSQWLVIKPPVSASALERIVLVRTTIICPPTAAPNDHSAADRGDRAKR